MGQKLTPMLAQYTAIKKDHPDVILMFRLGDFYEMFGDDAKIASRSALVGFAHGFPFCVRHGKQVRLCPIAIRSTGFHGRRLCSCRASLVRDAGLALPGRRRFASGCRR